MTEASRDSRTPAALGDLRVVEFAQALAIPYCGKLLSDLGANVVKVEPPRGDTYRLQTPSRVKHEGRDFAINNRGKRSVCLDLSNPDSREVIEALVREADVVLVSLKGSDVPRYGLDYETLRAINPRLVYLENSPYGRQGPLAQDGGYDVVAMGLSGMSAMMALPDENGETPRFVRPALADIVTGMISCMGVVTAIRHRDRTGEGQRVETSLLHTSLGLISNLFYRFEDYEGPSMDAFSKVLAGLREEGAGFADQQRAMHEHFGGWPDGNIYFRHFRTKDGFLSVGCLSPRLNQRLREVTGLVDPRGAEGFDARSESGKAALRLLAEEAEALFAERTTEDWLSVLRKHGVPCARLNFPHEIFDDPQARANGYIEDLEHPVLGAYQAISSPLKLEATPLVAQGPPPSLGAHTDEVLAEVGLPEADVKRLRDARVVGRYDE